MTVLSLYSLPKVNCGINYRVYRGVGAMEIVAMDMKLRGMYIARQLSFHGVSFKIDDVPLTDKFKKSYDDSVELVSTLILPSNPFLIANDCN